MHSKLLFIVLHLSTWAPSSAVWSATNGNTVISTAVVATVSPPPKQALWLLCNSTLFVEAVINIGGSVDAEVSSTEPTAITVAVAVVEDLIRFSALDPVSRVTALFGRGCSAFPFPAHVLVTAKMTTSSPPLWQSSVPYYQWFDVRICLQMHRQPRINRLQPSFIDHCRRLNSHDLRCFVIIKHYICRQVPALR